VQEVDTGAAGTDRKRYVAKMCAAHTEQSE